MVLRFVPNIGTNTSHEYGKFYLEVRPCADKDKYGKCPYLHQHMDEGRSLPLMKVVGTYLNVHSQLPMYQLSSIY